MLWPVLLLVVLLCRHGLQGGYLSWARWALAGGLSTLALAGV